MTFHRHLFAAATASAPRLLAAGVLLSGAAAASSVVVSPPTWSSPAPSTSNPSSRPPRQTSNPSSRCPKAAAELAFLNSVTLQLDDPLSSAAATVTGAAPPSAPSPSSPTPAATAATAAAAVAHLARDGICVVEGVVSAPDRRACLRLMYELERRGDGARLGPGSSIHSTVNVRESSPGRVHVSLFGVKAPETAYLERLALPLGGLLDAFFAPLDAEDGGRMRRRGGRRYYLSQLQLLDSRPGSENQIFHVDNARRGITILIPLVDVGMGNGPTELYPRSHRLFPDKGDAGVGAEAEAGAEAGAEAEAGNGETGVREGMAIGAAGAGGRGSRGEEGGGGLFPCSPSRVLEYLRTASERPIPGVLRGCCPAGAALLYDSRTLHRGGANPSTEPRPCLILRYDPDDAPPPGIGVVGTFVVRCVAAAFSLGLG